MFSASRKQSIRALYYLQRFWDALKLAIRVILTTFADVMLKAHHQQNQQTRPMKLPTLLTTLIVAMLLDACTQGDRVIESPNVGASNTKVLAFDKVVLTDTATLLTIRATYRPDRWINISSETKLMAQDAEYPLIGGMGIELGKDLFIPEDGDTCFILLFAPLSEGCTSFDFIEGKGKRDWRIYNINLTGKNELKGIADAKALYASVEELLIMGEYRAAEARIDSAYHAPALTREKLSMVYLLRSRLHQLRDQDPYRATKYMKLHVETLSKEQSGTFTPWVIGSIVLLLAFASVYHFARHAKDKKKAKNIFCTWEKDWIQAKHLFSTTTSGHLLLTMADNDSLTNEQRKTLLTDIETCFINLIQHIHREAPLVNREEAIYCICSGLHMSPRRMADCMLTTPSTLRSRKSRLRDKLPEYMYNTFFTERQSDC